VSLHSIPPDDTPQEVIDCIIANTAHPAPSLPPFDQGATCRACGAIGDIGVRWLAHPIYDCQTVYAPESAVGDQRVCHYWSGEHLHRNCRRCGFKWAEGVVNPTGALR
jgi:hypothetical protein